LDNHGRVITFTGPYELAAGKPYTIAVNYHTDTVISYAETKHYDPEYNADISMINFVDGLGRSVQVKKQIALFKGKDMADDMKMALNYVEYDEAKLRIESESDLVIEERYSNQVFQIVVRLLLCLRSILCAERATARDVESRLEDVAADGLDVLGCQVIVALQLEHGLQNRLTVN